ncbi:MAG: hypothetical protein ACPL5I_00925 [Thermodesulfobacteriota bacterium]
MKKILFLFLFLFYFCPVGQGVEDPKVRNLQGVFSLQIVIEEPTRDAQEAGIKEEAIKNQIKAIFKKELPKLKIGAKEGPSLYVRVALYKRKTDDLYYGMINVTVDRAVLILSPQGNFPSFSQVWENTMIFSGKDPLLGTYDMIGKLLQLLIMDLKKANP